MIIIGVDCGLTGALAVIDHHGLRRVFDIPTMEIPGIGPKALVKRKVDGKALLKEIMDCCPAGDAKPIVFIESVSTMGGQNNAVQTQGSLLRSLGAIEAVLECLSLDMRYVRPQTWKNSYGLLASTLSATDRKKKSMESARALYPQCKDISRAKDHNRAEAILIAHYGLMQML